DYVAVELAVEGKCTRFVDATNVDGVYTRDPAKHRDAKFLGELDFENLLGIIEEREWSTAGAPGVIDGPATVLLAREGIPTSVVKGTDLENLGKAVAGKPFHGTHVAGKKVAV
ncbi:MAG: UMP kinase, partial [Thermoplasmatota archaeon]